MQRKISRKEALEETVKMWEWLAEHPEFKKSDYIKQSKWKDEIIDCNCFLCEYIIQLCGDEFNDHNNACRFCPIEWPYPIYPEFKFGDCCKPGTPYNIWERTSDLNIVSQQAQLIVNLAKDALKKEEILFRKFN